MVRFCPSHASYQPETSCGSSQGFSDALALRAALVSGCVPVAEGDPDGDSSSGDSLGVAESLGCPGEVGVPDPLGVCEPFGEVALGVVGLAEGEPVGFKDSVGETETLGDGETETLGDGEADGLMVASGLAGVRSSIGIVGVGDGLPFRNGSGLT